MSSRNGAGVSDSDGARPRRRLIGVALAPSAATLGNLLCGVMAMLCCLLSMRAEYTHLVAADAHPRLVVLFPTYVAIGCYLVVLAMVFDALDGRLARMTRQTSEFGAQLDSIADIVSFGAAPALLYLTSLLRLTAPAEGDPLVGSVEWRIGWLCTMTYVSCAAIRLARYNAENVKDEAAQRQFSGLPTPAAAAACVALLMLHEDCAVNADISPLWAASVRWGAAPAMFALGLLMVSRVDYVHVVNVYTSRERPPIHLVWLVVLAGVGWFSMHVMLVVVALAYIVSGLLMHFTRRRRGRAAAEDEPRLDVREPDSRVVERR
jgi:CDP-diacylglycerol--serine O-phosphatidyltransferase